MKNILLNVEKLNISIKNKNIINDFNIVIKENETHVLMGPNGAGKSTFSKALTGHPSYQIDAKALSFSKKKVVELSVEERSHEGIFLAFQYPIEIPGLTNFDFLRIAYNEKQKYLKRKELGPIEFMQFILPLLFKLEIKNEFLYRNLNEGFSGGEKKRNEILQMILLEPKLIILDEIDSGLDIDAIKIVTNSIKQNIPRNASLLIITHYPLILNYLKPTFVHIMIKGKIVKTGGLELVDDLKTNGFKAYE
jgi:Fe-S cluster assembly ATP-binding protein